jgi:hypothetical protein
MGTAVYVYLRPGLPLGRDELEDMIDDFLGERGEVTGGGAGPAGSNIDIDVRHEADVAAVVDGVLGILRDTNVPAGSRVARSDTGAERAVS